MTRARKTETSPPDEPLVPQVRWSKGPDPDVRDILLDSREGIAMLVAWAKAGGFVLNQWHAGVAAKHGVSIEGVMIARPLPTGAMASDSVWPR